VQKDSLHFFETFSTRFYWIEGSWGEAVVVAVSFCSPLEEIMKKLKFAV
jgi:hypothetical protein